MDQKIISPAENYRELEEWVISSAKKGPILFVHGNSLRYLDAFNQKLEEISGKHHIDIISFKDFHPNPQYGSVLKGVELFRNAGCGAIMAAGGGSAMDVAKCIKLFSNMQGDGSDGAYLKQEIIPNGIPFLVMPMTAGTGSEATRYAVIYYEGRKQSVTHVSCIPDTVLFDPDVLKTLPVYQKKATMFDALCHALESFWSVNSNAESKAYAGEAIKAVLEHMEGYLGNTDYGNAGMLRAAYVAGKAINITQTTAGHAMCYKITSLFGCAHGHAAILCDRILFPWMISHTGQCIDPRGEAYLKDTLQEIAKAMDCDTPEQAAEKLNRIFTDLELDIPSASDEQFTELILGVNPVRLKNHPIALDEGTIGTLYHEILRH